MKPIRAFAWINKNNFGDMLTAPILENLTGRRVEYVGRFESNKVLCVGSIAHLVKENDTLLGCGLNRTEVIDVPSGVNILALRGPKTASFLRGVRIPEVFGDPAILLPLIYKPKVRKKYRVGFIPHMVEKHLVPDHGNPYKIINIQAEWKQIIKDILSCEAIISSSLHGVICAEAYGIPASWTILSAMIRGQEFKTHDYLVGTDRLPFPVNYPLPPIPDLEFKQGRLLAAIEYGSKYYF